MNHIAGASNNYWMPYRFSYEQEPLFTMTLQGEGRVMAVPSIAKLRIGVETIHMNLKVAQEENAVKSQQVLNILKEMGISDSDIQTNQYNIDKQYEYVEGKQIDKGYRVTNLFQVTIRNIDQVGEVIDTVVDHGANLIQGITFEVDNESYYYQLALNLSLQNALNKAEAIGRKMGFTVLQVPLEIVEESYVVAPLIDNSYLRREAQTPIEPGQTQITAKVRAVFSYQPLEW